MSSKGIIALIALFWVLIIGIIGLVLLVIQDDRKAVKKREAKESRTRGNNDMISRESLEKAFDIKRKRSWDGVLTFFQIEEVIDNAPTVKSYTLEDLEKAKNNGYKWGRIDGQATVRTQAEWTPVIERLPEERIDPNTNDFEYVLCSTIWDDVRPYKYGKPTGYHKAHFWHGGGIMDEAVIAWQYKPEPYKKGGAT